MSLQPLGHRILVKPDPPAEESASGLILPGDRDYVPVSGTVVKTGPGGNQMRFRTRQRAINDCVELVESACQMFGNLAALIILRENISGLLGTSEPEREVHVGDRVVFPLNPGYIVREDGEEYYILNEDDVAVLVEEAA